MRDVIIIPTYNERENINALLQTIFVSFPDVHVLVVDDSSPDQTALEVKRMQAKIPNLDLFVRPKKEGLGKAYIAAFKKVLAEGNVRSLCIMDADFSHSARYLEGMFSLAREVDVVVGSRYVKGGGVRNYSLPRRIISTLASMYCRILFRLPIRDYTSGFICIKASLLAKVDWKKIGSSDFAFLIELKYFLWKKGGRFKEFPIILENRREGRSKIGTQVAREGLVLPWRLLFKTCTKTLKIFFAVAKESIKKRGIFFVIRYGPQVLLATYLKKNREFFIFQNKAYQYFYHVYNSTCLNERAVEVPIAWEEIKRYQGKRILEVGNVLSHYFVCQHDILDKYETGEGVINKDVVDFRAEAPYDLIVSISTLEHVGFDEEKKDPQKILFALDNLKKNLAKNGKMIVTLCLGYNPEMDTLLKAGRMQFTKLHFLKRARDRNAWTEVSQSEIRGIAYNFSLWTAQGLVIGIVEN